MSMKLYLHKYTGDNRCINKWTVDTNSDTYKTVEVYNTTSLLTPQVVLDFDSSILSSGYNYCYINTYGRYYYITDMAADSGRKIIISLAVDVLNTYKSQILASPVNVIRWQGASRSQIYDSQYPLSTSAKWYVQLDGDDVLASPVGGYHFVLGVNSVQ